MSVAITKRIEQDWTDQELEERARLRDEATAKALTSSRVEKAAHRRTIEQERADGERFKANIMTKIGDLSEVDVDMNEVLVAVYEHDMIGSIHIDGKTKQREAFMEKCGLVLKCGPGVDVNDHKTNFYGRKIQPGEWRVFMPADGWPLPLRGVQCRLVPDNRIKMRVTTPDIIE